MNLSVAAWMMAAVMATAASVFALLRAARRNETTRVSYRALAVVAGAWGAAFVAQQAVVGASSTLTVADLLALFALPVAITAMASLPGSARAPIDRGWNRAKPPALTRRIADVADAAGVADGVVLAAVLLLVAWLAGLRHVYSVADIGPGRFALDLVHPLADLTVVAVATAVVQRVGGRAATPLAALLVATVGDLLNVGSRITGDHSGTLAQLCWLAAIGLLAATPFVGTRAAAATAPVAAAPVAAAPVAAASAVIMIAGAAVAGGSGAQLIAVTGAVTVLALAARLTLLRRQSAKSTAQAAVSDQRLRELAGQTSDALLLCRQDSTITYVGPAIAQFGYRPSRLLTSKLEALVHPEDRVHWLRAVARVCGGGKDDQTRIGFRVRAADGTWRQVETAISRWPQVDDGDLLLVTAHDVSEEVALRREVAELTFLDRLTGLPNRAYLQARSRDSSPSAAAGAILVDLDGFATVNASLGHGAGDLLLAQAARRISAAAPRTGTVGRWGDDEFAVLLEDAVSISALTKLAENLVDSIAAEPFRLVDREVRLTASVGFALAGADAPGVPLRSADAALARAKRVGGGRHETRIAEVTSAGQPAG